jgi:large subunit ribosomal protein L4
VAPEGYGSCSCRYGNGSPLWRGGGRIFPNSPEQNYTQKVNKKMFRAGMAAILSELARQDRLVVIDDIAVDAPKTKLFYPEAEGSWVWTATCWSSPTN